MTLPTTIISKPDLDISHHRIHEGNHFSIHKISTGVAGTKYFLIIPPTMGTPSSSTVQIHIIFEVVSDLGVQVEFFENGTVSANGTSLTPINNNRNSSTTALTSIFEDPTVTSDGTKLNEERIGTATSGGEVGEFERDEDEIILKVGAIYLLKITPLFGPINITTEFDWYDARPSSPIAF